MAPFSPQRTAPLLPLVWILGTGLALSGAACSSDNGGSGGASSGTTSTSTSTSTNTGGGPTTSSSSGTGGSGQGGDTSSSSGTGGSIDCGPVPVGQAPQLKLTSVASGLNRPLFVTGAPGDTTRLFIVEQGGRIKVLSGGSVLATPFLDIDSIVMNAGGQDEFGLLGLAFHPGYEQNGRFFVFYIANNDDSVVAEYARSPNTPDQATPAAVQAVMTITGGGGNHYSGMIAFGPDGYLYVGSGDRSDAGSAQALGDKRGKILRVDVDNLGTPPPGNLPGGDPYVWDYGVRNPWRFSFDRCAGDLYIGDVGGQFEEVNIQPAGQGHKDFGWSVVDTGTTCNGAQCVGVTLPVVAVNHNSGDCSVVSGYVYRGSLIPGLAGRFLHGDFCSNRVRSFVWTGNAATLAQDLTADLNSANLIQALASFGEDTAGNLYVVDLAGAVHRIDAQ